MIVQESDNYCIMCGTIIPEGRQICLQCEKDNNKCRNVVSEDDLKCIKQTVEHCISNAYSKGCAVSEVHQELHRCLDEILYEYKEEEE